MRKSLALDSAGRVFVVDYLNHRVQVFSPVRDEEPSAVPEPRALALLLSGALPLAVVALRRRLTRARGGGGKG